MLNARSHPAVIHLLVSKHIVFDGANVRARSATECGEENMAGESNAMAKKEK